MCQQSSPHIHQGQMAIGSTSDFKIIYLTKKESERINLRPAMLQSQCHSPNKMTPKQLGQCKRPGFVLTERRDLPCSAYILPGIRLLHAGYNIAFELQMLIEKPSVWGDHTHNITFARSIRCSCRIQGLAYYLQSFHSLYSQKKFTYERYSEAFEGMTSMCIN